MRKIILLIIVCLLLIFSTGVLASDYITRPGVLSPEQVDFEGKTVTIIRGKLPDDEERVKQAEKLFNVKLETLRLDNPDQFIARIIAGDSSYDIIRHQHREGYFPLVYEGMLLPADDYLPDEFFDSLPNTDRYIIEKLKFNGKRYGIGVYTGVVNDSMMLISYNKDMLKKYNQPDPYELYLSGQWTYEAFEEIAIAVTMDTDGDGMIDQYGLPTMTRHADFIRFAPSNGAELAVEEDGKWVFAYNRENAIHVLNTVNRWAELGIMGSGNYNLGEVAFRITHLGGNRNAQAAGINFGFVPLPKGPHTDEYQYPAFDFFIMYLPVNAEYPEGLIALANFLYREEDSHEHLEQMINDWMTRSEHLEVYLEATEAWKGEGDVFQSTGLWTVLKEPIESVLEGTKGAAAAMDEIAPAAQSFLDDIFRQ